MRGPETLVAGPHRYRVHWTRKAWNAMVERDPDRADHYGLTSHKSQEIWISPDQGDGQALDTLLHEAMHVVWFCSSLGEIHRPSQELAITHLTPWLAMLLRDNPALVSLLTNAVA